MEPSKNSPLVSYTTRQFASTPRWLRAGLWTFALGLYGCTSPAPDPSGLPASEDQPSMLTTEDGRQLQIPRSEFRHTGRGRYQHSDGTTLNGTFVDGLLQGIGEIRSPQRTYTGMLKDGEPHGHGELVTTGNVRYVGDFRDGLAHGRGTQTTPNGVYRGEWSAGRRHGAGEYSANDGYRYQGQWQDDRKVGYGRATYADGAVYDGQWLDGQAHGFGIYRFAGGAVYEGNWSAGQRQGYGTLSTPAQVSYEGMWQADQRNGFGRERHPDGTTYDGQWRDDQQHGTGTIRFPDGGAHVGQWRAGEIAGQGSRTTPAGIMLSGTWLNQTIQRGSLTLPSGAVYEGALFSAGSRKIAPGLLHWIHQQAAAGEPHAQYFLALAHLDFVDPPPAPEIAQVWLRRAAASNIPGAAYRLAILIQAVDATRMLELLQQAAQLDHAPACELLGSFYATGEHLPRNPVSAMNYLQRAADGGSISAANQLAWLLATTGDESLAQPQRAISLIRPFVILEGRWEHIATLAAAHARAGDTQLAAQLQQQAIEQAQLDGVPAMAMQRLDAHLALYQAALPYVE